MGKKSKKLPEGVTEKNGKYYGIVYLGTDKSGKKKRKWTSGFDSPREAAKARATLIHEVQSNNFINPSKVTIEEYFKYWIEKYVKKKLAGNTQDSYIRDIEKHIIPGLGPDKRLQKLQPLEIEEYYEEKRVNGRLDGKGGLSEKTLLYHHRIMTKAFNYAIYKMRPPLLKENPAGKFVDAPKPEKKVINTYEPEDCIRLAEALIGHKIELPINMSLSTDARRGEILGAQWKYLDLNTGEYLIKYQLVKAGPGQFHLKEYAKKDKIRKIVFPPYVIDLLKKHRIEQMRIKMMYGPEWCDVIEVRTKNKTSTLKQKYKEAAIVPNGQTVKCSKCGKDVTSAHVYKLENRTVNICTMCRDTLEVNGADIISNDLIFCRLSHTRGNKYQARPGEPVHPDTFSHWCKDFVTKNNLPPMTPHGLRHTGITLGLEHGVPLPVVSKGAGHDNPGFTGKQYHDSLMKTGRKLLADNKQKIIYDKVKR